MMALFFCKVSSADRGAIPELECSRRNGSCPASREVAKGESAENPLFIPCSVSVNFWPTLQIGAKPSRHLGLGRNLAAPCSYPALTAKIADLGRIVRFLD
jgi:hypothetical protein